MSGLVTSRGARARFGGRRPATGFAPTMGLVTAPGLFFDDFNTADRNLDGYNGWEVGGTSGSGTSGVMAIVNSRARITTGVGGFPGSGGGGFGTGLCRQAAHADPNIVDLSMDVVVGAGDTQGTFHIVGAGDVQVNGDGHHYFNKGIILYGPGTQANFWGLEKFTTANNAGSFVGPATSPTLRGATTTMRLVINRATGVVQVYQAGALAFTSLSGYASGFTGSWCWFGGTNAYTGSLNVTEYDNLLIV